MAAKKDDGKTEIDYVAAQNFIKENYRKSDYVQRVKWPEEWGFIAPMYKEVYDTITQGNQEPLPQKVVRIKAETFAQCQLKPESKRPLPPTNTKLYGWKTGHSIAECADRWIEPKPYLSMYKELGWGWDSQP